MADASIDVATMNSALETHEPTIVLTWLLRLRWLAAAGQIAATTIAVAVVGLDLPIAVIATVIAITAGSNALIVWRMRSHEMPRWLPPALVLLDVLLLTTLLYFTGGPDNPFRTLYLVHVAVAVMVMGATWMWTVVLAAAGLYALLFWHHLPLYHQGQFVPKWVLAAGDWLAIVLVSVLIAYFIGRIRAALHDRERELTTAREQAARNEHLAVLTTLAAGAAHELGTPLGTIAVVARELEVESQKLDPQSPMAEDARLIRQEVDRCRRIIDRMRVDSIETLRHSHTPIAISELLKGIVDDVKLGEERRLKIVCDPNLQTVLAPLHIVQQAVTVLIRNAFDASPPDGEVELSIARHDGFVVFAITDTGTGMPDDVMRRAGQPFFTTKDPGKGMGLGLFLVRLVAERAGGRFVLNSKPGAGTRSELHLPDASSEHS